MLRFIASVYRALISLLATAFLVGTIAGGAFMLSTGTGSTAAAVGLIVLGPLVVVLVFGTLAILIQNNELLHRIADAQGGRKPGLFNSRGRKVQHLDAAEERAEPRLRA